MLNIFKTLITSMLKKPATIEYPYKPRQNDPLVRGHVSNNIEACIFCGICQRKCPTSAIEINKIDRTWSIERFCCIQCNCCVELCPKKCLYMENDLTPASASKTKDVIRDARVFADKADHPNG